VPSREGDELVAAFRRSATRDVAASVTLPLSTTVVSRVAAEKERRPSRLASSGESR